MGIDITAGYVTGNRNEDHEGKFEEEVLGGASCETE